jgi:hypothetical protein
MFSHRSLFQLIAIPSAMLAAFPQLSRQIIARRHHLPLASRFEKAATVSFCLFFYFPPHHSQCFLTAAFFN